MAAEFVVAMITALMHECRIAWYIASCNRLQNVLLMLRRTRVPWLKMVAMGIQLTASIVEMSYGVTSIFKVG